MSGRHQGESPDAAASKGNSGKPVAVEKKSRKQKSGDIGRALRTIYDETVREPIPGDFKDLLGRLD